MNGQARSFKEPVDAQRREGMKHGMGDTRNEKAVDGAGAFGECGKKGRPVRERFVSGQQQVTRQRNRGRYSKVKHVLHRLYF